MIKVDESFEISESGHGEYTEKKSRFISELVSVKSEDQAVAFIESVKKRYHDARHNCSAYITVDGDGRRVSRFSDDGEPSGTAGRPILEVLEGASLMNAACVVTRYFGGVLLGTGGLTRAYSNSAKEALKDASLIARCEGVRLFITVDYNGYGKVEYILREEGLPVLDTRFEQDVRIETVVPEDCIDSVEASVTESTGGRAVFIRDEVIAYGITDGRLIHL